MTTLTRQDLNFGQGREAGPADPGQGPREGHGWRASPSTSAPGSARLSVVADVLCEFLEVAVHLILYVREVYPVGIFQKRKKYNVPVQVSPHSQVGCTGSPPNHRADGEGIFNSLPPSGSVPSFPSGLTLPSSSQKQLIAPQPPIPHCRGISFPPLSTGNSPCQKLGTRSSN